MLVTSLSPTLGRMQFDDFSQVSFALVSKFCKVVSCFHLSTFYVSGVPYNIILVQVVESKARFTRHTLHVPNLKNQSTVMLRALCKYLYKWHYALVGPVHKINCKSLMIYISFIFNKNFKTFTRCFLMKSWFLPHRLQLSRSSSMLWWSRISANSMFRPYIPRLSFLSVQRTYVELVNDILFDIPLLLGLPRTGNTEAMISHVFYKTRKHSKIIR